MSSKEILDQNEIDALLHGVDSGTVETESDEHLLDGVARPYDLANRDRIVRGSMPTLDMLNERFARYFRVSLFNMLRRSAEISVSSVQLIKFSEYVNGLFVPANLNLIKVKPLRGTGLIVIDPQLVFSVVDSFFGGDGRFQSKIEGREFTPTELRVVQTLLRSVYKDLREAWMPVTTLEFEYLSSEVNPQFANIASPSETVVVMRFQVDFETAGGQLHFTVPYAALEPVRELLMAGVQSDRVDVDDRWAASLREEIKESKVELACALTETEITLGELMRLNAGDVIPVDLDDSVTAKVEGIPLFRCQYGVSRGSNAIKLIDQMKRDNEGSATR